MKIRRGGGLGHVILKVLRGLSGLLGGPTSFKQAKENYLKNTKNGMGRRRRRIGGVIRRSRKPGFRTMPVITGMGRRRRRIGGASSLAGRLTLH